MLDKCLGAVLSVFVVVGTAGAQSQPGQAGSFPQGRQIGQGGQRSGPPRGAPKFAIDACVSKSEGESCEMMTPEGTRTGTCITTQDKASVACWPDHAPSFQGRQGGQGQQFGQGGPGAGAPRGGPPRQPQQLAIDACTGKAEGAACSLLMSQGSKSGTCGYTPDKQYYVCKPDDANLRPPPQGMARLQ